MPPSPVRSPPARSPPPPARSLAGYYAATTLPAVDTDLAAGNIKSGVNIFGVTGGLTVYAYGDNSAATVLTTAAGAGTYNAASLSAATVKNGTSFGVGLTGDYPSATNTLPSASATTDLAGNGTAVTTSNGAVEWWTSAGTRQTATLDLPSPSTVCSTATVNGSAGTLTIDAAKVLSTGSYCGTTGSIQSRTLSASTGAVLAGYYAATTLPAVDTDLTAANIKSGTTIFGVLGTLAGVNLTGMYDGTGQGFTGGNQANGGVDDYNNAASPLTGTYSATWTQCTSGNSYCGTSDSGAAYEDTNTGLIWSFPCDGSACATFSESAPGSYTWDNSGGSNGGRTASQICSDHSGWSLPHQKQLMMAYIDGAYGNLEASGVNRLYWSATTLSNGTSLGWFVVLSYGYTNYYTKNGGLDVRCVRPAP